MYRYGTGKTEVEVELVQGTNLLEATQKITSEHPSLKVSVRAPIILVLSLPPDIPLLDLFHS